jgi:hypothetical protein
MDSYKVRAAALLAVRNSLGIFLVAIAMVPVSSAIHRVFDGTWDVNWRLTFSVSGILTLIFFVFWFITQLLDYAMQEARERNERLVFPVAVWLRGIYLAGILFGMTIIVGMYREGDRGWILVSPSFLILIGFFAWPRAIRISNGEVRQWRVLFGTKRIPFEEIEQVVFDGSRGEAVVFGKNGTNIIHTNMHVQQVEFIQKLKYLAHNRVNSVGDITPD